MQFLGIRTFMRWVYYKLSCPRNKIKKISFDGIETLYYVNNPLELRLVETPFNKGMGDERELLRKILNYLKCSDVAYDIGASIGVHTIFMAKKVGQEGRIIAFEPEEKSQLSLKANVDLNSMENVEVIKVALGNDFADSELFSRGGTADFSLISKSNEKPDLKVTIMPGDHLVQNKDLPIPKALKIDVEGYEYYVIQGLEKTLRHEACSMVCSEIHPNMLPNGIKPDTVIELLKSFGFDLVETFPRGDSIHSFCYKRF